MKEKILIIDDEEDIINLLSSILEREGYEILTAADGVEGMEAFREGEPDLVITDVKMPRMNGLGVIKEIKESGSDVDVIILTGHSDEATAIACLRLGAYDYLIKPMEDIDVLLAAIQRAINKRNLELKNKQLIKQLEEMAIKDSLTGLYNYRHLQTCLDKELIRSERYKHTFCILMVDIDHFKELHDIHGHLFADYVFKKLSRIICQNVRTADGVYRYDNDAFFIIMPETLREQALSAANRLMDAIRSYTFECDGRKTMITVSIGGAVYPEESKDKIELIKYADQALYRAKEAGGNGIWMPLKR